MKKIRDPEVMTLRVLLEGGHAMDIRCKRYSFEKDNATGKYVGYKFDGIPEGHRNFGFNVTQVVGYYQVD